MLLFAIHREHTHIQQAGFPVTAEELNAWYEYPPGTNAATLHIAAAQLFNHTRDNDSMLPIAGNAKLPQRIEPLSNEVVAACAAYLEDNQAAIQKLLDAAPVRGARYPVDFRRGLAEATWLNTVRNEARLSALEIIVAAERGDSGRVVLMTEAGLGIGESLANAPLLISQLVRFACDAIVMDALQRAANRCDLSSAQLDQLSIRLAQAEHPRSWEIGMAGERCVGDNFFSTETFPRAFFESVYPPNPVRSSLTGSAVTLFRWVGIADLDRVQYLRLMRGVMAASRLDWPARGTQTAVIAQASGAHSLFVTRGWTRALSAAADREARQIALLRATRVGLKIQQYRLEQGKLPDSLTALVPHYLAAVPTDPFDGQPLRYKALTSGFMIYSLGKDRTDDGGRERDARGHVLQPGTDVIFAIER